MSMQLGLTSCRPLLGAIRKFVSTCETGQEPVHSSPSTRVARHSFITPTRSPKSGPEGTASLFLLSSRFLSSQNLECSKLAASNHLAMSVVRARGSCLAIRTLSPSTSTNRSCAHGSASSDDATCGPPTWIRKGLTCVCFKRKGAYERICMNLTPQQEERLKRLRHRMKVYFDASRPDHQDALRALWSATYPDRELSGLKSDQWKEMGWQGRDPSTDFRGAGFISLENLLFFAKTFSTSFQYLLKKKGGKRSAWEYPFAVAGVNITFMIMQMLDLDSMKPRTFVRSVFLQILSESEWAFDLLYCVAFVVMDNQWLHRNATYMEFNDILKSTRAQVERELQMDDVLRIEDMPSYSLLV